MDFNPSAQAQSRLLVEAADSSFFATPTSTISFVVDPANNVAADAYDDNYYTQVRIMQILVWLVMCLYLASFVASLFTAKYIGVEMMGVIQIAFIGLAVVNQLPPLMAPYPSMSYVNGVNSANQKSSSGMPYRVSSLTYGASLAESFNYSTVLLLLPLLISLVLFIVARFNRNDPVKKKNYGTWSKTILCDWGLTAVMFTLYHSIVSLVLFIVYGGSVSTILLSISIVEAIFIVGVVVAMAVLLHFKARFFGDYKKAFKTDPLSQAHYWILIAGRVLLGALLVGANSLDQVGLVALLIPLASAIYLAVRRPYVLLYNNIRAIVNEVVVLAILCFYGYYRVAVDHTMHGQPGITAIAWIEIVLLLATVVINTTTMAKYRCDIRKSETEAAKLE